MIIAGSTGVAIIPWLNWARNDGVFRFYTRSILMVRISVRPELRQRQRFITGRAGASQEVACRGGRASTPPVTLCSLSQDYRTLC